MSAFKVRKHKGAFFKTPAIQSFMREASKYPPLSREDEYALFDEYRAGSNEAKEKLLKHNMLFVVTVATHTCSRPEDIADAIGAGNIGLIESIEGHDHTRGIKFISYAVWHIKRRILEQTHVSRVVREKFFKTEESEALRMMNNGEYSDDELRKATGIKQTTLDLLKVSKVHVSSLNKPVMHESEEEIIDLVISDLPAPDSGLLSGHNNERVQNALSTLSERDRQIIELKFGFNDKMPATLDSIGEELNISRERARQKVHIIMKKLEKILSQTQNK